MSSHNIIYSLLVHYFSDSASIYLSESNVKAISQYVRELVKIHGFPLDIEFDKLSVLLHYFNGQSPKMYDVSIIKTALSIIKIDNNTYIQGEKLIHARFCADTYIVEMLPATFAKLTERGVNLQDLTYTDISSIVTYNYGPSEDIVDKIYVEQSMLTSYIKEHGFPLDLSFAEHLVLIHILHDETLDKFTEADINAAIRPVRLAYMDDATRYLFEGLEIQRHELQDYFDSIKVQ
jgi:hypothetical protein